MVDCFVSMLYAEGLGIANVDYYYYLNQSGTYTVDGTDDKKEFEETLVSLNWKALLTHKCMYSLW